MAPILFLLSPEVSRTSGTTSIYMYICIYVCIYVNSVVDTKSVQKSFGYFGEIRLFVPDFISKESFRPEEFFEV